VLKVKKHARKRQAARVGEVRVFILFESIGQKIRRNAGRGNDESQWDFVRSFFLTTWKNRQVIHKIRQPVKMLVDV